MKDKIKVIFRKCRNGDVIAFFPESTVRHGNIMSYQHIGQHGEATYDFYLETKKATEEEYRELLNELADIYNDCQLVVKQRLCYKDLQEAWKWRR